MEIFGAVQNSLCAGVKEIRFKITFKSLMSFVNIYKWKSLIV